jgi:inorganic pyrophosphatase
MDLKNYLGQTVKIIIDRPLGSKHPKHDFIYEINYGYVPETKAPDGEEIDAYLVGVNEVVKDFSGKCIAIIHRLNDDDDKLVIADESAQEMNSAEIEKQVQFQEKFFRHVTIVKQSSKIDKPA